MKKILPICITLIIAANMAGCGTNDEEIIGGADKPAYIYLEGSNDATEEKITDEITTDEKITDEQAFNAIKNYCYTSNPDLKDMVDDDNYTLDWEIESSDDKEIVVLYRSYTGALVRYYIDAKTGDTYVTEFVPGITDEEEKTDESFNVKDYFGEQEDVADDSQDKDTAIDEDKILEKAKQLSGAPYAEIDSVTEDGLLVIHLYEDLSDHVATYDWYTVDPDTLIGENLMGEEIDLN